MNRTGLTRVAAALLLACPMGMRAQARPPTSYVETGAGAASVSNGYGNWGLVYARAAWETSTRTTLIPEIAVSKEFHDNGTLFGLGAIQTLDADWYAFAAAATSTGGFYLPRYRGVVALNRKLLPARQLVLTAGASFTQWKDAHRDVGFTGGAAYYFTAPVVVEVNTTRNISQPGDVASQSFLAAVTEGRVGSHFLVARVSGGREAYAALAPGQAITDFRSQSASLTLRQWLTRVAGVAVGAEYYSNPFYHRAGLTLGGFWSIE